MNVEDDSMGCKCGSGWQFIDGVLKCPNPTCGVIAPFQPVTYDVYKKYTELLQKSKAFIAGDISPNDFRIFIENETL